MKPTPRTGVAASQSQVDQPQKPREPAGRRSKSADHPQPPACTRGNRRPDGAQLVISKKKNCDLRIHGRRRGSGAGLEPAAAARGGAPRTRTRTAARRSSRGWGVREREEALERRVAAGFYSGWQVAQTRKSRSKSDGLRGRFWLPSQAKQAASSEPATLFTPVSYPLSHCRTYI